MAETVIKYRYDDGTFQKAVPPKKLAQAPGFERPKGNFFPILETLLLTNIQYLTSQPQKNRKLHSTKLANEFWHYAVGDGLGLRL